MPRYLSLARRKDTEMNPPPFLRALRGPSAVSVIIASLVSLAAGGELTVKLTPAEIGKAPPYVTTLVAPSATCLAVGDTVSKVAVGQKINKEAQITLFPVDDLGKMAGAPITVKLPKPATLA